MVGTAIKSILETASIEAKIYGLNVPRRRGASWVIYTYISNVPTNTKGAASTYDVLRFQLDCYARTESRMDALGAAVRTAMDEYSGTVSSVVIDNIYFKGESDSFEIIGDEGATETFYRRTQDYIICIRI